MRDPRIVLITGNDFRDEEVFYPLIRLKEEGWTVDIATEASSIAIGKFGIPIQGTISLDVLDSKNYDIVILPGGNEAPERLRSDKRVTKFVADLYSEGKLVAAICHGVWIPMSSRITKGKKATCYKGIIDDLVNSGATYVDEEVVVDGNLITSRHPRDLAAFTKRIIDVYRNVHQS